MFSCCYRFRLRCIGVIAVVIARRPMVATTVDAVAFTDIICYLVASSGINVPGKLFEAPTGRAVIFGMAIQNISVVAHFACLPLFPVSASLVFGNWKLFYFRFVSFLFPVFPRGNISLSQPLSFPLLRIFDIADFVSYPIFSAI